MSSSMILRSAQVALGNGPMAFLRNPLVRRVVAGLVTGPVLATTATIVSAQAGLPRNSGPQAAATHAAATAQPAQARPVADATETLDLPRRFQVQPQSNGVPTGAAANGPIYGRGGAPGVVYGPGPIIPPGVVWGPYPVTPPVVAGGGGINSLPPPQASNGGMVIPTFQILDYGDEVGGLVPDPLSVDGSSPRASGLVREDGTPIARVIEAVRDDSRFGKEKVSGRSITLLADGPGQARPVEVAKLWRRDDGKYEIRLPDDTLIARAKKVGLNSKDPTLRFEASGGMLVSSVALAGQTASSTQINVDTRPGDSAAFIEGTQLTNQHLRWLMAAAGPFAVEAEIDAYIKSQGGGNGWRDFFGVGGQGWGWLQGFLQFYFPYGTIGIGAGRTGWR